LFVRYGDGFAGTRSGNFEKTVERCLHQSLNRLSEFILVEAEQVSCVPNTLS
jgi:hypothetical protein